MSIGLVSDAFVKRQIGNQVLAWIFTVENLKAVSLIMAEQTSFKISFEQLVEGDWIPNQPQ